MNNENKIKYYKDTDPMVNFPEMEENILSFWDENNIFEKSISNRNGCDEFVFYDGPPFANGLPHYGHLMVSFAKDLIARFQTMNGKKVERRLGWDCHGLPAEMAAEKELNIFGKKAITEYGIEKFNDYCRSDVMKYSTEWVDTLKRLGRWVDYKNDYKTMDLSYMESVINNFKQLYDKGLIFEDYRISPYSWKAESTVSNFEVNQAYTDRVDPALTVAFELNNNSSDLDSAYILAWTTTPWTLPSNEMLAVNKNLNYVLFLDPRNNKKYIIGQSAVNKYKQQLQNFDQIKILKGSDLVGLEYKPLFTYLSENSLYKENLKNAKAFHILHGDFVSDTDGTGIVHMAPAFGEDDFNICREYGRLNNIDFPIICPVDERGSFTDDITDFKGQNVFDANEDIIDLLKSNGKLFRKETYKHSYPHCWRTDTPLIYKVMTSWYVKVTAFKDVMINSNQNINWIPSHLKSGRMGKWLEGIRDWSISRNRFWGAPIPVWKSDDPKYPFMEVLGSIAEIEERCGKKITDLHRPFIDEVIYPNPKDPTGKSKMRRVEDVFDCWFESGSMPYAQIHYPFENKDWFEKHFPADFIIEAIDQTRGWFYTLIALSSGLKGKPAFKNCICTGHVMGGNNQKLSKRLKNYPDPKLMFDTVGSDALRWFLMSSPVLKGEKVEIDKDGSVVNKSSRLAQVPLYNAYHFFTLYANADGIQAVLLDNGNLDNIKNPLDLYILLKLYKLAKNVQTQLNNYEIAVACKQVEQFLEILNNWYIRLNRVRFWGTDGNISDQKMAFNILYTVLVNLCKIIAPIMPFTTEFIFKNLTGLTSVHLENYPSLNFLENLCDTKLENDMDLVKNICSLAKNLREEEGIKIRQPLSEIKIVGYLNDLSKYDNIIKSETNIKNVVYETDISKYADKFLYVYTPIVGKRLGKKLPLITSAAKNNRYNITGKECFISGEVLFDGEFEERLNIKDNVKGKALPDNSAIIIINTEISEELRFDGIARDFIRTVQEMRKNKNLNVSDRIDITFDSNNTDLVKAIELYSDYIKEQTLCINLSYGSSFDIEKV